MSTDAIRPAYSSWPRFNARLIDVVATLTDAQLSFTPTPDRWPLWATIGHLACQRVSSLCGLAGEPGAETTPFPNALYHCPGDEDLEHVLNATALVGALTSTFRIVEACLDGWTFDRLNEELHRTFDTEEWTSTRGFVIQRAFAHDIAHIAELNEHLGAVGAALIDLWE